MQWQAQRGILESSFAEQQAGLHMFHAHQSEFTELGWVGHFDVPLSFAVLAAGGLLVLLIPVVLSVTKPRGLTRYGWRK